MATHNVPFLRRAMTRAASFWPRGMMIHCTSATPSRFHIPGNKQVVSGSRAASLEGDCAIEVHEWFDEAPRMMGDLCGPTLEPPHSPGHLPRSSLRKSPANICSWGSHSINLTTQKGMLRAHNAAAIMQLKALGCRRRRSHDEGPGHLQSTWVPGTMGGSPVAEPKVPCPAGATA